MNTQIEHALTTLVDGKLLSIDAGRGRAIAVYHGQVWITQERDRRDVILGAGESFMLDRPGVAIVQALRDSSVLVLGS